MKEFTFEKEGGRWYVVLPEWTGEKAELEMVCGADKMLDDVAKGENIITLQIDTKSMKNDITLVFRRKESEGAYYTAFITEYSYLENAIEAKFTSIEVWLCHVLKFVYGHFPRMLYCKIKQPYLT